MNDPKAREGARLLADAMRASGARTTEDLFQQMRNSGSSGDLRQWTAQHQARCDGAEHFATACSEPATPGKNGLVICDRHEVERRAANCGITPQQWLTNIGHEHRIAELF